MAGKKRPERTPKFADYLRLFRYATTWDWCVYAAAAIASLGAGVTMPLMNILFGQLVGQFTGYFSSPADSSDGFHRLLDRQALYIMALFLGRWVLNTINKFCFRMIGIRISSAVRLHYLRSLFAQSVHVIDSMPPGAAATTITATANTLQLGVSEHLGTFLQHNGTIWAAFIIAFIWNWRLTLVTSSLIVYLFLLIAILTPLVMKWQAKSLAADARGTTIASEALGGIRSVMAFGAQDRVMSRYEAQVNEAMRRGLRIAPAFGLQVGLTFFGIYGAYILAFWYGTQLYIGGTIPDAGTVIVVLMSVMMGLMSVERVSTPIMAVNKATVAACEFFTVIDAPLPPSGDRKVDDIAGQDVVFDGVTFEYPGRAGVKVLDDLSFRVRAGKTTALVGASGSGKSTVVALVERWYSLKEPHVLPEVKVPQPPQPKAATEKNKDNDGQEQAAEIEATEEDAKSYLAGSISVDGIDLEELDLTWWRAQIGLVQQEPFLYNDTIANNVAHGLIGTEWASASAEQKLKLVQEACREAYADDFISRLPDGYDTQVGDGGIKLSGGQKQRIAIARSIIKRPQIIILDEATSAIDATSEKLVQAALDNATRGRTTITIAHRLSTIKQADHIVVLQNGRAVEQGTHQSLLGDEAGLYSALVRAQALRFSDDDAGSSLEVEPEPGPQHQVTKTNSPEPPRTEAKTHRQEPLAETRDVPPQEQEHRQQSRNFANSFLRLLYEQQARWPTYASILACAMAVAACTPLQAYLFAKLITVFLLDPESSTPSLSSRASFWCLMWLALACAYGLSWFATVALATRTQYRVSAAYKLRYLGDMIRQPLAFFDRPDNAHGTLTARVAGDAKMLEELLGMNLASSLTGAWIVVGCVAIAVAHAWRLGLVATFVTMPVMVASGLWKYRQEVQFDQMNAAVFAESAQFATEAIEAIRTVSSLTMESAINERYSRLLDGHVQRALAKARWTSALFGFADSAGLGCQALVFWYGGRLMVSGEYGLEAFFVCFMAIIYGAESASQVLSVVPNAAQASGAANRILDLQESARAHQALNDANAHNKVPGGEGEDGMDIELRGVSFGYPTRDTPVLKNLSVHIPKGHFAAFVGPSGCGKTTIISLLERFYDIREGAILCDGIDISALDAHRYRQRLALVAQEPTLFRGTVRDNVLFGVPDPATISEDAIHQACRDAFIHDFIVSLPEGYDTDVGHRGVSMSGGQKQRIALARALVREPKVLLLDEATSALDSESERYVQAALEAVRGRRTVIAVAHRLSTVQNADVIFFVEAGTVVEKGTHDELIRSRGAYWTMCQSQALDV